MVSHKQWKVHAKVQGLACWEPVREPEELWRNTRRGACMSALIRRAMGSH